MGMIFSEEIKPVELDWFDEQETIVVTRKDQARFEIQKDFAIKVLQVANSAQQFQRQLTLLLNNLGGWIKTQRTHIRNAYLTIQDNAFAFVVVRNESVYDSEFEDALS